MKTFYQRYFLSFVNSITLFCGGIIVFMVGGVSQAAISSLQKNDYSIEIQKLFQSALSHQSIEALQKEQTQSFEFSHAQVQSLNLPKVQLKASTGKKENFDGEDNVYLNLTHNIFRGGIDQKKLQISENQNFSLQLNQLKEQRQILKDIIDAYYAHWQNFWDFKNSQLSYELTEKRLKEISGRAQIGKSRSLEVLQAKAQLGLVEAQRKNAELNLEESKLKLKLMTGINDLNNDQLFPMAQNENQLANSLSRNNHSALLKNFTSLDLSQLNSSSQTEGETDLSAQQMSAEISKDNHVEIKEKILKIDTLKKEYSVKRKGHYPTLDLSSNYYIKERTGSLKNSDWDFTLTLSVPLYEGGATTASQYEAKSKLRQEEISLQETTRKIQQDRELKLMAFQKQKDLIKIYDDALLLAQKNYEGALRDYRLGLLSNLETLTALNLYLDAKKNSDRTKIQFLWNRDLLQWSKGN